MHHPIQRLHYCAATSRVYTATSNVVHVFSPSGELLSTWTAPVPPPPQRGGSKDTDKPAEEGPAPAIKKRKIRDDNAPKMPRLADISLASSNNAIIKLTTTTDGKHLVVATNEDKTIRVFSTEGGKLECLSSRALPKRVGDFALVSNDKTLLAGDKHGDVFALPLVPIEAPIEAPPSPRTIHLNQDTAEREALAAQKRQRTEIDYNLPYEHKFVIGHVSMLLSILPVTVGKKTWVLTGDRDEHIRVTRYPQTYVIDRFCMGHEAFVSELLIPTWKKEVLLSGGGDTYLLNWNWLEGTVNQKIDLTQIVNDALKGVENNAGVQEGQEFEIGVSGIWELPEIKGVLVGVEAVPAVFLFRFAEDGMQLEYVSTLKLDGNLLDLTVVGGEKSRILTSVDPNTAEHSLVAAYEVNQVGEWSRVNDDAFVKSVGGAVTMVNVPEHLIAAVKTSVLYHVRLLRKEIGEFTR